MVIAKLSLTNFRNHTNLTLGFDPGLNLVIGPNTSGKSNILEALSFLSSGRFYKAVYDKDCIKLGENYAKIFATVLNKEGEQSALEVSLIKFDDTNRSSKSFLVNNVKRGLNKFLGHFYSVLFSPQDLALVTNSPSVRRDYLDFVISQASPVYRSQRTVFEKVLRNRNKVLENIRDAKASKVQLEYWNIKLVECGAYLQDERRRFFDFINNVDKNISYRFVPKSLSKDRLKDYEGREIAAAATLIGPHKDDFELYLGDKNLKAFGSRGEHRTAILNLKADELYFMEKETGQKPVLLLDDIFSELDVEHRSKIIELAGGKQTIITSADENIVPQNIFQKSNIIRI